MVHGTLAGHSVWCQIILNKRIETIFERANKMELKHTKRPWISTTDGEANFYGIATKENWLMRIQQNGELSKEQQEVNIKLITTSPNLLEVCEKASNWFEAAINDEHIWETIPFADMYTILQEALQKTK